jgi:hypothetical protein
MFKATIFPTFISISLTNQVIAMAGEIFPDRKYESGYDMEDFLKQVLPDSLLDRIQMDPESSNFYAYFNLLDGKEVSERDLALLKLWLNAAQAEISLKYITTIQDRLSQITPEIEMSHDYEVLAGVS